MYFESSHRRMRFHGFYFGNIFFLRREIAVFCCCLYYLSKLKIKKRARHRGMKKRTDKVFPQIVVFFLIIGYCCFFYLLKKKEATQGNVCRLPAPALARVWTRPGQSRRGQRVIRSHAQVLVHPFLSLSLYLSLSHSLSLLHSNRRMGMEWQPKKKRNEQAKRKCGGVGVCVCDVSWWWWKERTEEEEEPREEVRQSPFADSDKTRF